MIETQERTVPPQHRRARPGWLGWVAPVLLAAAPWLWFTIRDASPSLDAVAVPLPLVAALLAVVAFGAAILSMRMRYALVSLSLVAFTIVMVLAPRLPRPSPPPLDPFHLVAVNTYDDNLQPGATVGTLAATRPDVLVAVETSGRVVEGLRERLPYLQWQHGADLNVFARWPLGPAERIPTVPLNSAIRVEVDRPGSPFVVYAIHLANPLHEISFPAHAATVERLLRAARGESLPVVLAGDFNMADRSTSYRALDGAMRDAMRTSVAGNTYEQGLWALLQLRIDHVFVSSDLCGASASTFGVPGSDHEALDVRVGACR